MNRFTATFLAVGMIIVCGCQDAADSMASGNSPTASSAPAVEIPAPLPPVAEGELEIRFVEKVNMGDVERIKNEIMKRKISSSLRTRFENGSAYITLRDTTDAEAVAKLLTFCTVVNTDSNTRRIEVRLLSQKGASENGVPSR